MSATSRRRGLAARLLALGGVTCAALAVGVTSGSGATPATDYAAVAVESPDSQLLARFPERVIDAGDLTGDGFATSSHPTTQSTWPGKGMRAG